MFSKRSIQILMNQLEENKKHFDSVTDLIAKYYGLTRAEIKSQSREGRIVEARSFVIYFLYRHLYRKLPNESAIYNLIGIYLGRDRITIRYHNHNMRFFKENDLKIKQHHFNLYVKLVSNDII